LNEKIPDSLRSIKHSEEIMEYSYLWSLMMEPQTTALWNSLGLVYLTLGRYNEAEDAIRESLDIDTSNSWTWQLWGDMLVEVGKLDAAENAYRMSIDLQPRNARVLYEIVLLQIARNAAHQALDTLAQLIELTPNRQRLWDAYTKCIRNLKPSCVLDTCLNKRATESEA
jgi:tetratricopeptide (TPR) repeat protein